MGFVEGAGIESSLPYVTARGPPGIPIGCVASMSLFESLCQRKRSTGNSDQMYMIGHETVAQQRKTVELRLLAQQLQISAAVRFVGKNYLPGIAALRNMMGNIQYNDAR